ncbi:S8 family serine peptidase [Rheinheimera salexigens]|uniref:Peptidase S8/S53 domain-containing protein n=2 Tax=Rheinheimera salexigens TaxID=1628148 RepID=A0A1E7Q247_9GAMM|nr:S8 family serine peptidase [Rheinheimera salexigens]OEY68257.1 hypothetical protein BI198_00770 [Rheinheimera salexigens]
MKILAVCCLTLLLMPTVGFSQISLAEPLLQQIPSQVEQQLQQRTSQLQQVAQQQLAQQQLVKQLAEKATLADPLTALPQVLAIVDQQGQSLWTVVEVEQGFRAVEREWLLLLTESEWQGLVQRWPELVRYQQAKSELTALGMLLVKLKVPAELDSSLQLSQQFDATLASYAGRNHIYQPQAAVNTDASAALVTSEALATSAELVKSTELVNSAAMCTLPVRLGMVDTAVALDHPALVQQSQRLKIVQQNFLPQTLNQTYGHGTAVAGLLAAQHADIKPLLPQLTLYSASAFYPANQYQQSATLAHILQGLNWLVSQQVKVINMSLTGPDNPVLAAVIAQLVKTDVILVAAAGNGGPVAAPLYPAAYQDVLAVTALDKWQQLYRWANQGEYIDYAAFGVQVPTLSANGTVAVQSGTSMAAPVLSAAVACLRAAEPTLSLAQIRQRLTAQARDLGEPGHDSQFGNGLIAAPLKQH